MGLEEKLLIWPKFGVRDVIFLSIVLIGLTIPFAVLAFYRIREARRLNRWILVSNFARKQALDVRETALLKVFFDSLSSDEQEAIIHNRAQFRAVLYGYLRAHREYDERAAVRTVDKMFPDIKHWHAVLSPRDLQPGEICGLEFGRDHVLATLVDIEEDAIMASLTPTGPHPPYQSEVGLYVYRPRIGGYMLHTKVERVWRGGVKLLYQGKVEDQGEQHLMARLELPLEFTPWSDLPQLPASTAAAVSEEEAFTATLTASEELTETPPTEEVVEPEGPVEGRSERVSDRGILFVSQDPRLLTFLVHGLWELNTVVGEGFQLTCRGRILPTRPGTDRYVFRFIDLSENARRVLVAEIKKRGGEREQLI